MRIALASLAVLLAPPALAACDPPTDRDARLAHLAPMTGFARAAGTTGGLDKPLFTFDAADDDAPARSARPGTLRAAREAARAAGGGWITPGPGFPRGGEVRLSAPLRIPSDVTLDGGCGGLAVVGPARGGIVLLIGSRNVAITRLRLRAAAGNVTGDRPGDCLGVGGGSDRVWIAYNAFGRCGDGALDVTQSVALPTPTRVTVAFNHFRDQDKVMLAATLECGQRVRPEGVTCPAPLTPAWSWESGVQVTLQGNLFDGTGQRHPRVSGRAYVHARDNVVAYRPFAREAGGDGASYGLLVGGGGRVLLEGGTFLPLDRRSGWAARVPPPRGAEAEQPGALRIAGTRAEGGREMAEHEPRLVPDPPYALSPPAAGSPGAVSPGAVAVAARCTGPDADPRGCGHRP